MPLLSLLFAALVAAPAAAQRVTTPEQQFGHQIGADYVLPNYTQFVEYWHKLSAESDRMVLDTIGTTAEGRAQLMAIITSPENHRNLARYKDIARRLALAEGVTEEEARQLAREGKPIVWFDGGLHATEVLGAQQLMETVYQLVSGTDAETLRFLDDLIIVAVHANPDGMELVSNWYMRQENPEARSTGGIPRLYQKYVGHDNNRDFFASTQPETENINNAIYREWFPQIVYNHHQTGPAGAILFAPPYRDPFNHNYDPLIMASIDQVGSAMHARFLEEGKGGATMRSGANYSTWWNGGLRTMPYFHNMIGLLTETIGNPTPMEVPFVPDRQIPHSDLPLPVEPQTWHFRQSIDYSVTANRAVFDYASDRGENLLFNIWRMGMNAIERGSGDSWTNYPRRVIAAEAALERRPGAGGQQQGGFGGRGGGAGREEFIELLRKPEWRDPRGFILPADQPDFPTAAKFVEALLETGIAVHRATSEFTVGGETYPAGSFVVKTAQAFAPHVIDMFEPQDHPDDIPYPGAAPTPPYDAAGWTLAFQMGVEFDRILEGFDGPFQPIEGTDVQVEGSIGGSGNAGFLLSHQQNDAFVAVNRLLAADRDVFWLKQPVEANGRTHPAGTFFVPAGGNARRILEQTVADKGITVEAVARRPSGEALELEPVRIALWDRYGGSMPSGWTRWIMEQFEFPFEVVYPQRLDAGDLDDDFDVLVFVDGAIPAAGGRGGRGGGGGDDEDDDIPEEYRHMLGNVSAERTIPQIRAFLEQGGTVITIGSSTSLAEHLGLPVTDHLVGESGEPLPRTQYYVPGSVLQANVDTSMPIAHGLQSETDFFFDNSPVFRLGADAAARGVRPVATFGETPLRSGWVWGNQYLNGGVVAAEADVGEGKLFLFGPEILFRAQPHGTFKLFFNGIYYGTAEDARLR
jgi:hypothetical protein